MTVRSESAPSVAKLPLASKGGRPAEISTCVPACSILPSLRDDSSNIGQKEEEEEEAYYSSLSPGQQVSQSLPVQRLLLLLLLLLLRHTLDYYDVKWMDDGR